jgi:hypothetical protein
MSVVDNGTQTIRLNYGDSATTSNINKRLGDMITPGLISGGQLSISSGNDILIATLEALVLCPTGELIGLSTSTPATLTLSSATPYITVSHAWLNVVGNYADFTAKAYGSINSNDVVLGKGIYVGATLTSFDISMRTLGFYNAIQGRVISHATLNDPVLSIETKNAQLPRPNFIILQNALETTNGAANVLDNIAIPSGSSYMIENRTIARCIIPSGIVASGDSGSYVQRGLFKRVAGGNLAIVGSVQNTFSASNQSSWGIILTTSGNNVVTNVSGTAGCTILWNSTNLIQKITY